jgi:hypothetical protein
MEIGFPKGIREIIDAVHKEEQAGTLPRISDSAADCYLPGPVLHSPQHAEK